MRRNGNLAIEARGRLFDAARGRLTNLTDKAVETLERLMHSDKPSVALAAAKAVLEAGPRLRAATEIEERICHAEDQADEQTGGNETSAGDEELIRALAAGALEPDAAAQAGPEKQTADFQRAVSRARGRLLGAATNRLAGLASEAVDIFEQLMDSEQPSVARRAAKAVLQLGPRLRQIELEERMRRLEDQREQGEG